MREQQLAARICGAIIAFERKKLSRGLQNVLGKCEGSLSNLTKSVRARFDETSADLAVLEEWTVPKNDPIRGNVVR